MKSIIEANLAEAKEVLDEFMKNPANISSVESAARIFSDSIVSGHKIISCGNGGSMTDAMHFAEELTGKYREVRKALPAMALADIDSAERIHASVPPESGWSCS